MDISINIQPFTEELRPSLVAVWERSVRATHDFLKEEDIEYYRWIVIGLDYAAFPVYCLMKNNKLIGFLGVADRKIEMLFVDADEIGKGYGKHLLDYAFRELKADKVDVNEQNQNAVKFYNKFGFETYGREEKDPDGKDYPILKMKLASG